MEQMMATMQAVGVKQNALMQDLNQLCQTSQNDKATDNAQMAPIFAQLDDLVSLVRGCDVQYQQQQRPSASEAFRNAQEASKEDVQELKSLFPKRQKPSEKGDQQRPLDQVSTFRPEPRASPHLSPEQMETRASPGKAAFFGSLSNLNSRRQARRESLSDLSQVVNVNAQPAPTPVKLRDHIRSKSVQFDHSIVGSRASTPNLFTSQQLSNEMLKKQSLMSQVDEEDSQDSI